ncbi:MAG: LamG domain-containing protein [Thermoplasmata archaeon]|nr:LamG domain-containing protein [Thermoplasmata archaeon]
MKKILFILLFVLAFTSKVLATDYCTGAAGCYLFLEGTGTVVNDTSSNTNTGTFASSGHPAWASMAGTGAPAYADYMVDYTGTSSDYIDIADHATLDITNTLSICSWINADATPTANFQLVTKDGAGTNTRSYGLIFNRPVNTNYVAMAVFKTGNSETFFSDATTSLVAGTWYHLGGAYNYISDGGSAIDLYVNGIRVANMTTAKGTIGVSATTVNLGKRQYTGAEGYFHGKMSETLIANAYYTATEFDDIMDNGLLPAVVTAVDNSQVMFISKLINTTRTDFRMRN